VGHQEAITGRDVVELGLPIGQWRFFDIESCYARAHGMRVDRSNRSQIGGLGRSDGGVVHGFRPPLTWFGSGIASGVKVWVLRTSRR
jgi:hypothetical protein